MDALRQGTGTVTTVRVRLVDDDALVRAGLTMMLGEFDGIEVTGAASDGTEVAAAVNSHRPDVVLMDIRMPGVDGLTATEALRARREPPEVIVLTTFDTDAHVLRASGHNPQLRPPPPLGGGGSFRTDSARSHTLDMVKKIGIDWNLTR